MDDDQQFNSDGAEQSVPAESGAGQEQSNGKLGRRALMLGGVTGAGAAASLIVGASPAGAANNPVLLNQDNPSSGTTSITTSGSTGFMATVSQAFGIGVWGESDGNGGVGVIGVDKGSSGPGAAVSGQSNVGTGVWGYTTGGSALGPYASGVWGDSNTTVGVVGTSATDTGVLGISGAVSGLSNGAAGVWGDSDTTPGVLGTSNNGDGVQGMSNGDGTTAVHGDCRGNGGFGVVGNEQGTSAQGIGVLGLSKVGTGVWGQYNLGASLTSFTPGVMGSSDTTEGVVGTSNSNYGVYGASKSYTAVAGETTGNGFSGVAGIDESPLGGYGVYGESLAAGGIGVHAQNTNGSGTALQVQGIATFTRSGMATLGAAATSVVVTVPGTLKATSHVLATLQTDLGAATLAIHAAVPNPSTGKVTIYFTGTAPVGTKVAWFVFG